VLNRNIQMFADNLHSWCRLNKLQLNPHKTTLILFASKNKHIDHDLNVKYNNVKISVVNEGKFLGVWFDKKMTWKKHISELNKKLRGICGMINR